MHWNTWHEAHFYKLFGREPEISISASYFTHTRNLILGFILNRDERKHYTAFYLSQVANLYSLLTISTIYKVSLNLLDLISKTQQEVLTVREIDS